MEILTYPHEDTIKSRNKKTKNRMEVNEIWHIETEWYDSEKRMSILK